MNKAYHLISIPLLIIAIFVHTNFITGCLEARQGWKPAGWAFQVQIWVEENVGMCGVMWDYNHERWLCTDPWMLTISSKWLWLSRRRNSAKNMNRCLVILRINPYVKCSITAVVVSSSDGVSFWSSTVFFKRMIQSSLWLCSTSFLGVIVSTR